MAFAVIRPFSTRLRHCVVRVVQAKKKVGDCSQSRNTRAQCGSSLRCARPEPQTRRFAVRPVEASVTLGGRAATRVEVSLAGAWRADSMRVWVRNSCGDLERLVAGERVITLGHPMSRAAVLPTIRVLVESDDGLTSATLAVPLEYRVRGASGCCRDVEVRGHPCHPSRRRHPVSRSAPGPGVSAGPHRAGAYSLGGAGLCVP